MSVKVNVFSVLPVLLLLIIYIVSVVIFLSTVYAFQRYEELMVIYPQGYDVEELESVGCTIERVFTSFNVALLTCPTGSRGLIEALGMEVVPNFNVSVDVTVSNLRVVESIKQVGAGEQGIPTAWSWAVSRVGADIVWKHLGVSGHGSTIAILDTGVDPTHPLLANKLRGWIEFDRKGKPVCSNPRDTHGHGTWVASIAAGGDVSNYIFGIAPNAKIMAALVLTGGYGTAAQVLAGLEWSLDPYDCMGKRLGVKPAVVSMSFGAAGNYSNIFLPAIAKLIESGIVPVASIGNAGPYTTSNPGNIWGVIGVGATDFNNDVAWFSSYENVEWPEPPQTWPFKGRYPRVYRKPDVVAPGVDVPGAFPGELIAIGSGTSASAPIVAGIAAMVSEILAYRGFRGVKLVEEVYNIITSTATNISIPGSGNGLVNAFRAVSKALDRRISNVEVKVEPSIVAPLERLNVSVRGIMDGMEIAVYMAGVEVYRGVYRAGRPITITAPPTHIGGNEVAVVDRRGEYYGEALVFLEPFMYLHPQNITVGKLISILVSGLGIGDLIAVYMENTILTLATANLRGSYTASLAIPYVQPGRYSVTLRDFTTPTIRLHTTIYVVGEERRDAVKIINRTEVYNYTILVKEYVALPITVSVKQHYIFGVMDYVDVVTVYPNITIKSVEVRSVRGRMIAYSIVNITEIHKGVYRLWFTVRALEPISEEDAIIALEIVLGRTSIRYPVPIKLLAIDPIREGMERLEMEIENLDSSIHNLNGSIINVESEIRSISRTVSELLKDFEDVSRTMSGLLRDFDNARDRIERLDDSIRELEEDLAGYKPTISHIESIEGRLADVNSDVRFLERMMYIVLVAALASIAIAVISVAIAKR